MTKEMLESLDKWLAGKDCINLETTGTEVCRLKYRGNKIKRDIAIAFSRYHHSTDPCEYVIADVGYVLVVPSFWLSIPKELVLPYICGHIDDYIKEYITGTGGSNSGGTSGGGNYPPNPRPPIPGPNPPCPNRPPIKPECPVNPNTPPPPHVLPTDECDKCEPALSGYYVDNDNGHIHTGGFTNTQINK